VFSIEGALNVRVMWTELYVIWSLVLAKSLASRLSRSREKVD